MTTTKLRIQNIGPHADRSITMNLGTVTTISGPSRAGKTTILHAIAFALWGQDATGAKLDAAMSDATPAASFDGCGRNGTKRAMIVDGASVPGGTEDQFRAMLPAHYRDPETAGLVMFPMRWMHFDPAGDWRALRSALDRMLPGPTALDLLADLPAAAPRQEKAAAELVSSYRADAKTARGRAQGLRSAVPATPPPAGPTAEQVDAAKAQIAAAADARADLAVWRVEQATHSAACVAVIDWKRRRSSIVEPAGPRAEVTQAMVDAADAERDAIRQHGDRKCRLPVCAGRAHRRPQPRRRVGPPRRQPHRAHAARPDRRRDRYRPRRHLRVGRSRSAAPQPMKPNRSRDWTAEPTATACPGAKGCQIGERARVEADRVNAEHAAAWSTWLAWDAAQIPDPTDARDIMSRAQEWARFNSRTSDLGKRPAVPPEPEPVPPLHIGQARSTLNLARNVAAAWASYDERIAAIGPCPDAPPDLRPRPEVPDLADADEVVTSAARAAQRLADYGATVSAAEAKAVTAEEDATTAEQLLTAAEGWLLAVRSAPARALAGKLALLGEGSMQVLDDNGKTQVKINGRPWYLASHGERVAADAGFRLRLRAAAGLDVLPVFVDDVSSVGGIEIPTAPGVVLLVTTADGDLTITERAA